MIDCGNVCIINWEQEYRTISRSTWTSKAMCVNCAKSKNYCSNSFLFILWMFQH